MSTIVLLSILLAAPQGVADTTDEPLLRAVPKEALFVASIPRAAELRARGAENLWVNLARDPAWKPMRERFQHGLAARAFSMNAIQPSMLMMQFGLGIVTGLEGAEAKELERFDRAFAELEGLCLFVEPAGERIEFGLLLEVGPERDEVDAWLGELFSGRGVTDRASQDGLEIEVRDLSAPRGWSTHLAHVELPGLSAWVDGVGHQRALERARGVATRWKEAEPRASIGSSGHYAAARRDAVGRAPIELYADHAIQGSKTRLPSSATSRACWSTPSAPAAAS